MPVKGYGSSKTVELLKPQFPKFSKIVYCMIQNPEYGVDYSAAAKRLMRKGEKKPRKEPPNRKKLTVRVSPESFDKIREIAGEGAYQEILEKIINDAIGGKDGTH